MEELDELFLGILEAVQKGDLSADLSIWQLFLWREECPNLPQARPVVLSGLFKFEWSKEKLDHSDHTAWQRLKEPFSWSKRKDQLP